ncbi:hypothetical protein ATE49_00550 [Elizabethkingia miricola]|nr:hypothetical protein [Elizabethkingia sp. ASV34]OBS13884.1 hypothetical protein ATE49_00550 [Elizabethkingia miricola]OPB85258.1 hypothetical protein BAS06_17300 [Elizabethkingia miricola]PSL89684.1 hypothetical protein C7V10_05135 [Elizabethkingia miricola]
MCFKAKIKFFYTALLSKTISSGFKITLLCVVIKEKTAEFSGYIYTRMIDVHVLQQLKAVLI